MKKVTQWLSVNDVSLFLNFCEVSYFRGIKSNNSRRFFVGVKNDEMVYLNQMVCFIKAQRGVWVLWYNLPTHCEMLCMVLVTISFIIPIVTDYLIEPIRYLVILHRLLVVQDLSRRKFCAGFAVRSGSETKRFFVKKYFKPSSFGTCLEKSSAQTSFTLVSI